MQHLVRVDPVLESDPRNRYPMEIRFLNKLQPFLSTLTGARTKSLNLQPGLSSLETYKILKPQRTGVLTVKTTRLLMNRHRP